MEILRASRQEPTNAALEAAPKMARLAAIYRDHYEFVWRGVRRLGIGEAQADDVVQDVFLIVHRRLDDFEGRSALRTWLFGIALRVVKDHRRRADRADRRHRAAGPPPPPAGPEEALANARAVRLLDEILDTLNDDQRAVFVLAEVEGMTAPEIADALEVKLNTVYSRLRLARRQFNRALSRARARETSRVRGTVTVPEPVAATA